ncbi:M15 family metallopeptidase [Cohnella thailandensis]|uniref:M15 family metallopeptidase n=2 Tax=Cohnella thailandensis TaxID=557557 RepID=A0A841T0Y0_9BACL|nr:M15 family metallopeptidase [Cohnella thailandensis]
MSVNVGTPSPTLTQTPAKVPAKTPATTPTPTPGANPEAEQWTTITLTKDQVYSGPLVLVNREHKIRPEALPEDIVDLSEQDDLTEGYSLLDPSIELSEAVALRFRELVEGAARDGVRNLRISSGYRNNSEQEELYEEKGSDYALPAGHSEHNLGLSLDLGSTTGAIDQSAEGKWLKKHAWDYGFILRYPKDKVDLTGIQYEPWHFRYVGLPHSRIMKEKNFVLEEYLAYLKEKESIVAEEDGVRYRISYVPVTKRTEFKVPVDGSYEISGDNSDGVIVTVALKEAA